MRCQVFIAHYTLNPSKLFFLNYFKDWISLCPSLRIVNFTHIIMLLIREGKERGTRNYIWEIKNGSFIFPLASFKKNEEERIFWRLCSVLQILNSIIRWLYEIY